MQCCPNCDCSVDGAVCSNCDCNVNNYVASEAELANARPGVTLAPSKVLPPIWPPIAWILGLAGIAWILSRKKG